VFAARSGDGADLAFAAFDVLQADGHSLLAEPWEARRRWLELLLGEMPGPRVQLIPLGKDARTLWRGWVMDHGGEGIVLKLREAPYRPGLRTTAWLKAKQRLELVVEVLRAGAALIRWGDWGWAAVLAFAYTHPRTGGRVTVEQAVRVVGDTGIPQPGPATVRCWGVMPSGLLRHPERLGTAA
jgi:ATP-dependent DNA ligase